MMTEKFNDGGPAFPVMWEYAENETGMSLRDWFAGQALGNPEICTGSASGSQLREWFGGRSGIAREEIVARQAWIYADAMLAARQRAEAEDA